jgi:hypothetical protein
VPEKVRFKAQGSRLKTESSKQEKDYGLREKKRGKVRRLGSRDFAV